VWVAGLTVGVAACVALLVIPFESTAWVLVARGTSVLALGVFLAVNLRLPPSVRGIWWAIWAYELLTVAGDVVYDVQERLVGEPPFPGPADALYVLAYLAAFTGLLWLVGARHPDRDAEAWIDTMIVTIAAAAVVGVVILAPTIEGSIATDAGAALGLLYPVLDIIVLSGLVRLLVGGRHSNPALILLVTAFGLTLVADLLFNVAASRDMEGASPALIDAIYLASLVVMTAAAAAPGASTIDEPSVAPGSSRGSSRLVGLTAGALTIPVLLLFIAWSEGELAARLLTAASIVVILLVVSRLRQLIRTVQAQSVLLESQARTDGLTGIANRRTLDYELERLEGNPDAGGQVLTVAMLDLDHFKEFNDRNGHRAGDQVLVDSTRAWRDALGERGFLARYGGEEFTILLPGCDLDEARELLEEVRRSTPGEVTVSVGLAERADHETGFEVLSRADRALYAAKAAGRDRIVTA
jgi:diguanylate cyclase (GGDEF)-like protein